MSLDDYFRTGPVFERPIFDAAMACLAEVGPVHVEPVSVGIFLKNPRKFAELRPLRKWVAISFSLHRVAAHRTITRKVMPYGGRYFHMANVADPNDFDPDLAELLIEAYDLSAS